MKSESDKDLLEIVLVISFSEIKCCKSLRRSTLRCIHYFPVSFKEAIYSPGLLMYAVSIGVIQDSVHK